MVALKRCLISILICVLLLCACLPSVRAAEAAEAENLTHSTRFSGAGYPDYAFLTNGDNTDFWISGGNTEISLHNDAGMGSLYIMFDQVYGAYTIADNDTGASITAGEGGYLHEFVDLEACFGYAPTNISLFFLDGEVSLCEMEVYGSGQVPGHVQRWDAPLDGNTDIALFSTHGDDEQLYFAGLLPLYAGEKGLNVQVIYMTDHHNFGAMRPHEMLDGLWAVGVTHYPVFGHFVDFKKESMEETYATYETLGVTREELLGFVVENLRRFRPLVAIGHDLNGEYGHGMHMVYADLLTKAVNISSDAAFFPESVEKYGTWDVPKTYLHLYEENPIVMDYDQPLAAFDGLTAFQVNQQLGFPCHKTQQDILYTSWLYGAAGEEPITKASQIEQWSPCLFGLYRSTVGPDVEKDNFMENILTREERAIQAEAEYQESLRQQETNAPTEAPPETETSATEPPEDDRGDYLWNMIAIGGCILLTGLILTAALLIRRCSRKKSEKI